jgi:hypothetical protein
LNTIPYNFFYKNNNNNLEMVQKVIVSENRWSKILSEGAPCGRYGHRVILCKNKMILHGGYNGQSRLNDLYEYNIGITNA